MTKRIRISVAALVVGLVLAISCSVWAGAQIRTETKTVYYRADLKIIVDGRQTTLDVTPFIIDPGWIMVPAEFISKQLGATVAWDDADSAFTITTKGNAAPTSTSMVTYTLPNGDTYMGEFRDGQRNGQGTYTWANGATYVGQFKDDQGSGLGTFTWSNGDTYVGQAWDGKPHGLGVYQRAADGHIQGGLWVNGVFASTGQPITTTPTVPSTPDVIESRIDGTFEGWSGDTIFKLANGQIWQQTSYAYTYHYAYRPEVVIYRSGLVYKMSVEGVGTQITVKRLK